MRNGNRVDYRHLELNTEEVQQGSGIGDMKQIAGLVAGAEEMALRGNHDVRVAGAAHRPAPAARAEPFDACGFGGCAKVMRGTADCRNENAIHAFRRVSSLDLNFYRKERRTRTVMDVMQ